MAERDERALREALQTLGPDEPIDPGSARHRAAERRRNGRVMAGIAVALVLVASVVGIPRLLPAEQAQPTSAEGADSESGPTAASAPTDPAPPGWRTEYYRDISFQVPANWGYAVPPDTSWCSAGASPTPKPDQRRPYVWLDVARPIDGIACPPIPDSLLTEHVEALTPGPATDYVEGGIKTGDFWVITRFAGSAVLVVTTTDRSRGERILNSADVEPEDAPCRPSSPIAGPVGTRPEDVTDLTQLPPVDWVVLCQYEPVADQADVELPRLRAAIRLSQAASQDLVNGLATAPVNDQGCDPAVVDRRPDLAVLMRIWIAGEGYRAYVNPAGCPGGSGMSGGVDDGTTVRVLTTEGCQRLLTPPIALFSGSGDVGRNCLG
jgi:hypothetical protein